MMEVSISGSRAIWKTSSTENLEGVVEQSRDLLLINNRIKDP